MERHVPTYEEAMELFLKYNKTESLINHGKAVSGVMTYLAKKHGEDEEKWRIIGLCHDLDYEMYPKQHCTMTKQILDEAGWDEDYINSILSHAWGMCTDIEPKFLMEKYLYATDELTGLITACAYVRPSKSVMDMEVKSVKKKWKQKAFAAGANREVIAKGAEMLGVTLDELIQDTINGMREVSREIGL